MRNAAAFASRPDLAGAFFENRSSILWWENPFVWAVLIVGAIVFVEWIMRGNDYGR